MQANEKNKININSLNKKVGVTKSSVDELMGKLNEEQLGKVKSIMSDNEKLNELLNSPAAKNIIEKLERKQGDK